VRRTYKKNPLVVALSVQLVKSTGGYSSGKNVPGMRNNQGSYPVPGRGNGMCEQLFYFLSEVFFRTAVKPTGNGRGSCKSFFIVISSHRYKDTKSKKSTFTFSAGHHKSLFQILKVSRCINPKPKYLRLFI